MSHRLTATAIVSSARAPQHWILPFLGSDTATAEISSASKIDRAESLPPPWTD
jgi:hypothetical protein